MNELIKEMSIFELGINVTITGIVLVFSMLILLVAILMIFGSVSVALSKAKEKKAAKVKAEAYADMMADSKDEPQSNVVTDDDSDELVAVISAAVSAMYSNSKVRPVIKSIKKASSRRSSWAKAGIADNTKAF